MPFQDATTFIGIDLQMDKRLGSYTQQSMDYIYNGIYIVYTDRYCIMNNEMLVLEVITIIIVIIAIIIIINVHLIN